MSKTPGYDVRIDESGDVWVRDVTPDGKLIEWNKSKIERYLQQSVKIEIPEPPKPTDLPFYGTQAPWVAPNLRNHFYVGGVT